MGNAMNRRSFLGFLAVAPLVGSGAIIAAPARTQKVVVELIVDASGMKTGAAEFEAALNVAKWRARGAGRHTARRFNAAQKKWQRIQAANDPRVSYRTGGA